MNHKKYFICLIPMIVGYSSAKAGLFDDNEARTAILDIRTQITQNKQQQEQNYNQLQTGMIALQNQIETLQNDKKSLDGQLENVTNDLLKVKSNYQTLANSYTDRLDEQQKSIEELKQHINIKPSVGNFVEDISSDNINANTNTNTNSNSNNSEASQPNYTKALKAFNQGNFSKSAELFNMLLSSNSDISLMPLIIYYLGSSYYALQKYKLAIVQLNSFINNYPKHEKLPNVYFALASSYFEMGDKINARRNFEYIIKNYSNNNVASIAKQRLTELKN